MIESIRLVLLAANNFWDISDTYIYNLFDLYPYTIKTHLDELLEMFPAESRVGKLIRENFGE